MGSPGFPADGSEERTPRDPPHRQPASVFPDLSSSPCVRDAACRPEQGPVRGPQVDCDAASRGTWHPPARRCTGSALRMLPGRLPCSSALVEGGSLIPRRGQSRTAVGAALGPRAGCGPRVLRQHVQCSRGGGPCARPSPPRAGTATPAPSPLAPEGLTFAAAGAGQRFSFSKFYTSYKFHH